MPTVQHAIDVAATPDDCWRVFSDLATWTRWFPMLRGCDGELRAGGRLTLYFAAGPARLPVDVTHRGATRRASSCAGSAGGSACAAIILILSL